MMAMPAEQLPERPDLREVEEDIYDPVAAVAREAEKSGTEKGFPFTVGGEVFRMRSPKQIGRKTAKRIDSILTSEDGSALDFFDAMFEALLGPDQFARFDEVADLTNEEMNALLDAAREYNGISLPESDASTDSSPKKA